MLEAMVRISSSQPNEAMACIAPRSPMVQMVKNKIHSTQAIFFGLDSKLFSKVQIQKIRTRNFTFSEGAISNESHCSAAAFVVNSEPHIGARPSVWLCVGPIK
jgi:hypothetical protein